MPLLVGGDHIVRVSDELAAAFESGDRLLVVPPGDVLHLPTADAAAADRAVATAADAFAGMGAVHDDAITHFYEAFAHQLSDDSAFAPIAAANAADVASAKGRGRSTTRLMLSDRMRGDMVAGLRGWASMPGGRDRVVERVDHDDWRVELRTAGLGVVGFVFEGRPNVFADATGVLRGGNTVVFRIGSDALGTARAIAEHALAPALADAGLPPGAVSLVDSPSRASGWALFSDERLALAVARGSGEAVAQLGAVARQAGVPVSLHGTGGGWVVAGEQADAEALRATVCASLDRKVCNTLNVCVIPAERAAELVPAALDGLADAAAARETDPKLHVAEGTEPHVPDGWFDRSGTIVRAEGPVAEPVAEAIAVDELGTEWEWEHSPEISLVVVGDLDAAIELCNRLSPRLVATLVSSDGDEHDRFWSNVDAPFVGDGFTRWVDGQYALGRPELGLSNWEHGRLFARGGVLSGDSVFTVRTRAWHDDPGQRR
ncbi:MAG: aldehyde dehydrogenase family protein [Actinomycetota bacterium]